MTQRDYEWRYKVRINLDGVVPFDALTPEQESTVVQELTLAMKEMHKNLQKVREISLAASTDTSLVSPILCNLCDSPLLAELDEVKCYKEKLALEADPGLVENALNFFLSTYAGIAQKLKEDTERIRSLKQEQEQHESATGVARKEASQAKSDGAPAEDVASKWEKLIQNNKVIADYSSLISQGGEQLFVHIMPLLEQYDKKLNIPQATIFRMQQEIQNNTGEYARQYVGTCYQRLMELERQGRLHVCGFSMAKGVDLAEEECREIMTLVAQHKMETSLLVLTQNKLLAEELMELNNQQSAKANKIKVKGFNKAGYPKNLVKSSIHLAKKLREGQDSRLPLTEHPTEGSPVYTEHGMLHLQSVIGDGGEGCVYRTESSYVAKIYKPEHCTAYRLEKLQKMLDAKLKHEGICFPVELLKNSKGEFVGYLMEEASAKRTLKMFTGPGRKKHFPDWNRLDVLRCSLEILKKLQYLHSQNIVLEDINPKNILIADDNEHVYFVDTDSYQINDLPCPVGMIEYTAPELHQMIRNGDISMLSETLRTKEHDNFANATLLFQMMMVGMKPYTKRGECNNGNAIIAMEFGYGIRKEKENKDLPEGPWRFKWSMMDDKVKEAFIEVFNWDDRTPDNPYNIKKRYGVDKWIRIMENYQKSLEARLSELDAFCKEHHCNWQDVEKLNVKGCKVDPQIFTLYPNRNKRSTQKVYEKCVDCGNVFYFNEVDYTSTGMALPKRCAGCRAKRKLQREAVHRPTGAAAKPIRTQPQVQPSAPVAANPATPSAKTEDSKKKSLLSILFGW